MHKYDESFVKSLPHMSVVGYPAVWIRFVRVSFLFCLLARGAWCVVYSVCCWWDSGGCLSDVLDPIGILSAYSYGQMLLDVIDQEAMKVVTSGRYCHEAH